MSRKKIAIHWQILIAMGLGILCGYLAAAFGWGDSVVLSLIKFIGDLFMRLLRMISVPLVLFSLVAGVASLSDTQRLAKMGGKTIALYLATTAVAIVVGLGVANSIRPGNELSPETRDSLRHSVVSGEQLQNAQERVSTARSVDLTQQFLDMFPTNPFDALSRGEMLQVVVFAVLLGVALTRLPREKTTHVISLFQRLSDAIIEIVSLIMKIAPIGVFGLITTLVAQLGENTAILAELGLALGKYVFAIVLSLVMHTIIVYMPLIRWVAKVPLKHYFSSISPAMLLAFSSSSSSATLPVTIDCVEKGFGVDEEASSFVLPLGSTINMDGTGLYQGVAAVFIATMYNMDLSTIDQLQIVLMALLASIGTAGVPGVGIVMLVLVLQQINVPVEGIALILAVDRPLDMCRTVLNVTGDTVVCTSVARSEGMITPGREPVPNSESESKPEPEPTLNG